MTSFLNQSADDRRNAIRHFASQLSDYDLARVSALAYQIHEFEAYNGGSISAEEFFLIVDIENACENEDRTRWDDTQRTLFTRAYGWD